MTPAKRHDLYSRAAIAAMNAITANPVAWMELKTEAACNRLSVGEGLAAAACNLADELIREIELRQRKEQP